MELGRNSSSVSPLSLSRCASCAGKKAITRLRIRPTTPSLDLEIRTGPEATARNNHHPGAAGCFGGTLKSCDWPVVGRCHLTGSFCLSLRLGKN